MSFTGVLGTNLSNLGNIILGLGLSVNIKNENLTISCIASITSYYETEPLVILSGFSNITSDQVSEQTPAAIADISINDQYVANRITNDTLNIIQDIKVLRSKINLSDTLNLTQSIYCLHIHNENVTQTLTINQDQVGFFNINETLNITQTILTQKIKNLTINQTLTIVQTIPLNIVANLHVDHTLIYNIVKNITSPLITASGRFVYHKPNIIISKIDKCCNVILQSNNSIITLKCPQFGDTENNSSIMNLKRTMTGDTYTYVRHSLLRKLKYNFFLGRIKSLELRQFIYANSDKVLKLMNWKGEIWYTYLINNPFDFIISQRYQKEQERVDITLEFEGVKLC